MHFQRDRAARVMEHYRNMPCFAECVIRLLESDVMERREKLRAVRCRDDDWFFAQFGCTV